MQLADRAIVMSRRPASRRPATVQKEVTIDLRRPRNLDSPQYLKKRDLIFHLMGMSLRVGETAVA